MLVRKRPNVGLWLQADIQPPEIDFRFTPNSGRSRDLGWTSGFDPKETLALPQPVDQLSLATLWERLIEIGAKVVRHGRQVTFQLAEAAIP